MISPRTDAAKQLKALDACASEGAAAIPSLVTAGGTGDNTKRTGATLDRLDATGGLALSALLATVWRVSIGDAETLTFAHEYETSADGSSWDTAVVIEAATTYETGPGGGDVDARGELQFELNLEGLKRYVRFNVTPNLSRANTDILTFATVCVFGGFSTIPVS